MAQALMDPIHVSMIAVHSYQHRHRHRRHRPNHHNGTHRRILSSSLSSLEDKTLSKIFWLVISESGAGKCYACGMAAQISALRKRWLGDNREQWLWTVPFRDNVFDGLITRKNMEKIFTPVEILFNKNKYPVYRSSQKMY
ncbi:hypothetical protein TSAR_005836 [Trichomalopsis sarcophagae]|uniref:Uncharacterized protein n=1 Tax=Trichomalopsis sarcophagae TaxID=543379 RepID=A0A232EEV4_9HYME|nr:hypothetical protein TSAR_005836 [Trichomalopsis sarcophagae]